MTVLKPTLSTPQLLRDTSPLRDANCKLYNSFHLQSRGWEAHDLTAIELLCRGSTGSSCVLEGGLGFLTFSSDGSDNGLGFRAHVLATISTANFVDSVHFFNETQIFTYPPSGYYYLSNARALAVFQTQPNSYQSLQLTYLSTETDFDYVHFFTIFSFRDDVNPAINGRYVLIYIHLKFDPKWSVKSKVLMHILDIPRWSGTFPEGVTDSQITSQRPHVALFLADSTNQYLGFTIDFQQGVSRSHQTNRLPIPLMWASLKSQVQKAQLAA